MPIKGDMKKDFLAARNAVKDSLAESAKVMSLQILAVARRDGIIQGQTVTRLFSKRKNRPWLRYEEVGGADRHSKRGKKVFHHSKFMNRTGNLLRSLTPAGGFAGNRLGTLGEGSIEIEQQESVTKVKLNFEGKAAMALGAASKNKYKITVVDKEGNFVPNPNARRRPIEDAARSVKGLWETASRKELDKRMRALK